MDQDRPGIHPGIERPWIPIYYDGPYNPVPPRNDLEFFRDFVIDFINEVVVENVRSTLDLLWSLVVELIESTL